MLLLPIPLPDELLASILARMGRWNGVTDLRDILGGYLGASPCTSFIDARINLPDFCERTFNAYGTPDELLEHLTLFGLRSGLGEISESEWSNIVQADLQVTLSALTFPNQTALRFCRSCVHDDIEQHGECYWHLSHQFPVVQVCTLHGERLKKITLKRSRLHQSFPLPSDVVDPFAEYTETEMIEPAAQGIAKMVKQLLASKKGRVSPDPIDIALLDGLRELKLANNAAVIHAVDLIHYLMQILFGKKRDASAKELLIVRQVIRSIHEPSSGLVAGRALLLYCLYGDCAMFRQRVKWLKVMGGSVAAPACHERCRKVGDIQTLHRDICLRYIAENHGCSRLDFTKAEYRSFRWLLHNDSAWLDKYLPIPIRGSRQYSLFD